MRSLRPRILAATVAAVAFVCLASAMPGRADDDEDVTLHQCRQLKNETTVGHIETITTPFESGYKVACTQQYDFDCENYSGLSCKYCARWSLWWFSNDQQELIKVEEKADDSSKACGTTTTGDFGYLTPVVVPYVYYEVRLEIAWKKCNTLIRPLPMFYETEDFYVEVP